ncbi:hypothetical protein LV78_008016 [Actinosynnema pretiosum]|nr:hypothetical protein [Actinosynnema pretiosum]
MLPWEVEDLEGWLVAVLRVAAEDELFAAVEAAERAALTRYPAEVVSTALRRVLSHGLVRHR